MSKLNIYETSWIDLVFENRNKDYGAYHLRQENTKTSFFALFVGVSLLTAAISVPMVYNYLNPENRIILEIPVLPPIEVTAFEVIMANEVKPEEAILPEAKAPVTEDVTPMMQLKNPEIVTAAAASTEPIATNDQLKDNINTTNNNTTGTVGTDLGTSATVGVGVVSSSVPTSAIIPSAALDKKPEFPGGINKFYTYVGNNFEKPELDIESAIRVSVAFVIEKDGSMTDIKVLNDPGYGLGVEAIRVLKSLKTKWSPGMLDGKAVRTSYHLPITIQLNQ